MLAGDDATLARAAQDGDMEAFAVLLARHRPLVLAICRQTLRDPMLAEDAAQEACLRALVYLGDLRRVERFGSWLAGIGINLCRMWLRSRSHECRSWDALHAALERGQVKPEEAGAATQNLRLVGATARHDDPEARIVAADLSASVRAAVAALPNGQQAAVRLYYLSGLSYRETAALLGIAEGAVRTRLHKARSTLRGTLRAVGEEEHLMVDREATDQTSTTEPPKREYACSFCGKKTAEVRRMIAGPGGVYICDECIALCNQIIAEEEAKEHAQ